MKGIRRQGLLSPRSVIPEGVVADEPVRTLVAWVPDWPLVAAGIPATEPAAVFVANRVVACTAAARQADVRRHMRRREAQARCPTLLVLDHDPDRDARLFEPVLQALEALTPRIEVTRPGRCAFPTIGPSRYFGGDDALAHQAAVVVAEALADRGSPSATASVVAVGVADGPFAAAHAARAARTAAVQAGVSADEDATAVLVVPAGGSSSFVAPLPLTALDRPDLADLLRRLGLYTLGDLAALPAPDILGRFGADGAEAHRLARGFDARPPVTEPPPPDLVVSIDLDPPADQVAPIAFVARGLADELHGRLDARGAVCTRIVIIAETERGERSERMWRHEGALSAGAIADRVRWQMDGWLHANSRRRPSSGIIRVCLQPDEVVAATGRQLGFWGADASAGVRASRAVARVQGLLGADAVQVAEYTGGRDPAEQLRLVPAGAVDLTAERPAARPGWVEAPWPGRLPSPSPALLHHDPVPADVVDARGRRVVVDGRCTPTASPAELRVQGGGLGAQARRITAWAGPWPVDERWWDPDHASRRARFQVVTADGVARLVVLEGGCWSVRATYA